MKTQSNFQDHLRLSKDTVSKWPEWKRDVMGVALSSNKVCSTTTKSKDGFQTSCGAKIAKK